MERVPPEGTDEAVTAAVVVDPVVPGPAVDEVVVAVASVQDVVAAAPGKDAGNELPSYQDVGERCAREPFHARTDVVAFCASALPVATGTVLVDHDPAGSARVADPVVCAGATVQHIGPESAVQGVRTFSAEEIVITVEAVQYVIAGTTDQRVVARVAIVRRRIGLHTTAQPVRGAR